MDKPVRAFFALRRRHLDLALPEHGYLYFDHLTSELRIISESHSQASQDDHPGLTVIIDEMNKKRKVADFTKNADNATGVGLMDLLEHGRPTSTSNYAKLIIWSFLAGFAERFVPDTLSRFISKREGDNRGSA